MTKRVVLIGHPVAHSLSGAMQQAAFDHLGIDATYELWDRAPTALAEAIAELRDRGLPGRQHHDPAQGAGGPARGPPDRTRPMRPAPSTPSPRRAGSSSGTTRTSRVSRSPWTGWSGRQKMPRHAVVLGAGGGSRAVVHGLIREGFQRVVVFNRHLHRAEGMVKHFGAERRAHGPARDALARVDHRGRAVQDEDPGQRHLDRPERGRDRRPRRDPDPGPAGARPDLRPDAPAARGRVGRAAPPPTAS